MAKFRKIGDNAPLFESNSLPPTFKLARSAQLQLSKSERDLFTDMEETASGNYIVSGITKQVSELDFTAISFGLSQKLYNQSYQSGNADVNSGLSRRISTRATAIMGSDTYKGEIAVSLNELCRLSYGTEPTTELKKKVSTILDTLHKKPLKIKFPNGDSLESKLCLIVNKYTREKDGAVFYNLYLNPIFGIQIKNQFGELPQDVIATLDESCKRKKQRKQAAHYLLLRWLSVQDKRMPHTLMIDTLVYELRMEEYFRKDRGKAEKQLLSVCDTMKEIGILSSYEAERSAGARPRITKITFYLNQSYIRDPKGEVKKLER